MKLIVDFIIGKFITCCPIYPTSSIDSPDRVVRITLLLIFKYDTNASDCTAQAQVIHKRVGSASISFRRPLDQYERNASRKIQMILTTTQTTAAASFSPPDIFFLSTLLSAKHAIAHNGMQKNARAR